MDSVSAPCRAHQVKKGPLRGPSSGEGLYRGLRAASSHQASVPGLSISTLSP